MGLAEIDSREYVERAANECDRLGRWRFLSKYGFDASRRYYLRLNGRMYDSKAILGVAHKYAVGRALRPAEFSGGLAASVDRLRALGFEVVEKPSAIRDEVPISEAIALVLTENEVTYEGNYDHWNDVTGSEYHFPNQYRNSVLSGRPFLYYRGVRRAGGHRGQAEYFGVGRIGDVWPDPANDGAVSARHRSWHCSILDFVPFGRPVRAIDGGVGRFEGIADPLRWRNGVRMMDLEKFEAVLAEAGVDWFSAIVPAQSNEASPALDLPDLSSIVPNLTQSGHSLLRAALGRAAPDPNVLAGTFTARLHRSQHARLVGERAEAIVLKWLRSVLTPLECGSVRHVSADGKHPGWDIQYLGDDGAPRYIEVKGTSAQAFTSIEISANEWGAAAIERENFWLFLVAGCLGLEPRIERIQDPANLATLGVFSVVPLSWGITRCRGETTAAESAGLPSSESGHGPTPIQLEQS